MTKPRWYAFAAGIFVVAGLAVIGELVMRPSGPRHKGKPLEFWAYSLRYGTTQELRSEAALAIREMGTNGIPWLVKMLESPQERSIRRKIRTIIWNVLPIRPFDSYQRTLSDLNRQSCAITSFGALGPASSAAVPVLFGLLLNTNGLIQSNASQALKRIGPEAKDSVPFLVEQLKSNKPINRSETANVLRQIGVSSDEVIEALLSQKDDSNPFTRAAISGALRTLAPEKILKVPTN